MILHNNVNNVSSQINDSSAFTIKTSAKAFKILSDNLYADKISAVIREYSTNAYDSHVAAGKADTPFEVHLPTQHESWFSVKDFGTGMSDADISSLFTSYFDSDKTERNDMVGALGLGSKSAFAYTDTFTVESNYDNKRNIYTCFISENGTPQITKMHEEEINQVNGVTIKFSVKKNDMQEFASKATKIYRFFKTTPKIIGNEINVHIEPGLAFGEGWKISKTERYSEYKKAFAVMGNVAYPLDEKRMSSLSIKHHFILNNAFRIDFALGELDVAASRESLSYDTQTIVNIKAKLDKVFDGVFDFIASKVRSETSAWDATKCFHSIITEWSLEDAWDCLPILYNNEPLKKEYSLTIDNFKGIDFVKLSYDHSHIKKTDLRRSYSYDTTFVPGNQVFVFKDESTVRICSSKARSLCKPSVPVIYISEFRPEIISALGGAGYTLTSNIEKPKLNPSEPKTAPKPFIPMENDGRFNESISLKEIQGDKVFYIPINRFKPLDGKVKMDNKIFADLVKSARELEIIKQDDKIYGVLGFALHKTNNSRFINVLEYIRKNMETVVEKWIEDVKTYHRCKDTVSEWFSRSENKALYNVWKSGKLIASGKMLSIFTKVTEYADKANTIAKDPRFNTVNKLAFNSVIDIEEDKIDDIKNHYPMLGFFGSHCGNYGYSIESDVPVIQAYINGVDGI